MLENKEGRGWALEVLLAFNLRRGRGEPGSDGVDGVAGEHEAARERISVREGNAIEPGCRSAALACALTLGPTCESDSRYWLN